jgi:hypothetical protein
LEIAKDISLDIDIDTLFHTRHKIKRKRQMMRIYINYFIPIVDQAISSLRRRFEHKWGDLAIA